MVAVFKSSCLELELAMQGYESSDFLLMDQTPSVYPLMTEELPAQLWMPGAQLQIEVPADVADVVQVGDTSSTSIVPAGQQSGTSEQTKSLQQPKQPARRTRKAGSRRTSKFSSKEDRTKKRNREAQRRFRIAQKERQAGLLEELEQLRDLVSTLKAKNAALAARLNAHQTT